MTVSLDSVVPWGRNFEEYQRMFRLTPQDLQGKILGCSDGPASFNAEATAQGIRVVSCDPIYAFSVDDIRQRIDATYGTMLHQVRLHEDTFVWDVIPSPEKLGDIRMQAMNRFLEDFPQGKLDGRYVVAELPQLPFNDAQFDLAISGNFLFLYAQFFSLEAHIQSVKELCRVAAQVRMFPLLDLDGKESPHLAPTVAHLTAQGYQTELIRVDYEFQVGGHTMLQVSAPC